MKRYKVIRPPIYIDTFAILELGEICTDYYSTFDHHFRRCKVEQVGEMRIMELRDRPLEVGMHVHYDVSIDDYAVFDPAKASPKIQLIEVEPDESQETYPQSAHIRI